MTITEINYFFNQYTEYFPYLIPLGAIGVWRWSVWGFKKIIGSKYRPKEAGFVSKVSVITPVYNENPKTFLRALKSWDSNHPDEIIAVIDYADKSSIGVFSDFAKGKSYTKLIITKIPGKRVALGTGIKAAKSNILALVDSDTLWEKDTLKHGIAPFVDPEIGGVATRQSLERPMTLAQKLFSMRLEQRYWDDFPFLAQVGNQIVCLSGRTAIYRKKALLPIVDKMMYETFMGEKVISGEDKRLTYLVERKGWKTTYQSTSRVSTIGEKKLSVFFNQQIRWTRNSWRNDLKALYQKWVFRYPIFALYLIDRAIQPFTSMISPIYFIISLIFQLWIPAIVILVWWHVSRAIKMYPHLRKYPHDILILPLYIVFNFISAYIRIYALLSINTQGWITRWHKSRIKQYNIFVRARAHMGTIALFSLVVVGVYQYRYLTFLFPQAQQKQLVARTLPSAKDVSTVALSGNSEDVLGVHTQVIIEDLLTKKHIFQTTDTLSTIAEQYKVPFENLLQINSNKITNWDRITPGLIMTIPPKDYKLTPFKKFNNRRIYPDALGISYDEGTETIIVSGRGNIVTLSDIAQQVSKDQLEETSPGIWYLKSNLYLRSGLTMNMSKDKTSWLRLKSNKNGFVNILAYNSDIIIDHVKITSWDETKNNYDTDLTDGRSYILIKDNSRMDLNGSEIAYLGYARPKDSPYSTYGISWRMSTGNLGKYVLTGEVVNSKFHHNYFGAYTYGATGMTFRGNEFYQNVRYGLDPHDDSNGFLVENNSFHDNGTHGLIFSKRCINNTIRNNISYNNKLHGIMLHELSSNNVVENNKIFNNNDGISIDNASGMMVRNNTIYNNKRGIVADKKSVQNIFEKNILTNNTQYGFYFYNNANKNTITNNILNDNSNAIYIKTNNNQIIANTLNKNKIGINFQGNASQNQLINNKITYSSFYGVYAKLRGSLVNIVEENNYIWRNDKNIAANTLD